MLLFTRAEGRSARSLISTQRCAYTPGHPQPTATSWNTHIFRPVQTIKSDF